MKLHNTDSQAWKPTFKDNIIMTLEGVSFIAQVALCILFFNSLNLNLLLYLGGAVFIFALVVAWRARVAFEAWGEARKDENWLRTTRVLDSGIYRLVRHPMYLSFQSLSLSLVLFSQHWLSAVLGTVVMGLLYSDMCREEQHNVQRLGNDYLLYMERVPRMNLLSGVLRLARRNR